MIIALDLPPQVEKAYLAEAHARGLPLDAVVREVLIAGLPKDVFEQGLGLFGSPKTPLCWTKLSPSLMRIAGPNIRS